MCAEREDIPVSDYEKTLSSVYNPSPEERAEDEGRALIERVCAECPGVHTLHDLIVVEAGKALRVFHPHHAPIALNEIGGLALVDAVFSEPRPEGNFVLCVVVLSERVAIYWLPAGALAPTNRSMHLH
jgi:hypothetical protein